MSGKVIPFAPTAAGGSSPQAGTLAAAVGGEGDASRSAHSPSASAAASARVMVNHARLSARAAARGDKALEARMVRDYGEALLIAGIDLLAEPGP